MYYMGHLGVTKKFFCLSEHFYDYFYDWGWNEERSVKRERHSGEGWRKSPVCA